MNFEMILDNCCDQEAFQSWSWMKGNWGDQEAFQSWSWMGGNWGDQEALQSWSWIVVTKGLFNLDLDKREPGGSLISEPELWWPRGFLTSILMKGNQGAFQPWNRSCNDQGAFQPWNQSCDDQGAFQPRSWWKVTKGLFNLEIGVVVWPKGFSTSI